MTDDDLRELERRARAGGTAEKLALAAALDRVGRGDDALDALIEARDDADVRREIGRRVGVVQNVAHLVTCAGDFAPLARAPRARWALRPRARERAPAPVITSVVASPLGIVASSSAGTIVLDPADGTVRRTLPRSSGAVISGELLVRHDVRSASAHDLWTGDALWAVEAEASMLQWIGLARDVLVLRLGRRLAAYGRSDARTEPLWTREVFELPYPSTGASEIATLLGVRSLLGTAVASASSIVASTPVDLLALDPATGAEQWRSTGASPLIDANGDVAFTSQDGLVLHAPGGEERWRISAPLVPLAFTESAIVGMHEREVVTIDRATGAERARFAVATNAFPLVVRDVIVALAPGSSLAAFTLDGETLWSFELPAPSARAPQFWKLAALPRAIVAMTMTGGQIICLEEGESR